jgi:hypothetical protein
LQTPNTCPKAAITNKGAPHPCHSISITSLTSDDVHPATTAVMMDTSFWLVNMHKALDYFITKHLKVASAISTVLITMGSTMLHLGIVTCISGPKLVQHTVQAVGAVTVAAGKWLRATLNSATAK